MIIYENTLGNFKRQVELNEIQKIVLESLRQHHISGGSAQELRSWNNSLNFMKNVLTDPKFPDECMVAIEYNIPQTSKRVDFLICGSDESGKDNVVIVELKQWARVQKVDDISKHSVLSDLRSGEPTAHPSYQAYSYKALIKNYCEDIKNGSEILFPCAYLHNMDESYRVVLEDSIYKEWIKEAPVFLLQDVIKLRDFISKYIKAKSKNGELLYKIEYGKIRPQKSLQDSIDSMLCGNEEFKMIDDQVVAFDLIMKTIANAQKDDKKHAIIIQGGPGTGKSVLAINILAECIRKLSLNASYITKNGAPRNCYSALLSKGNAKKEVDLKMAFKSPHALPFIPKNGLDVGIFDEAHRMQEKPFMYKGYNMLKDAIRASKVSVFFYDGDQRITIDDEYTVDSIINACKEQEVIIDVQDFHLTSQFRCNGSDGFLAFVDNLLGLKETANNVFDLEKYDFKVFDDPIKMRESLREKANNGKKARMVAGYCYDWNVKYGRGEWDVIIGDNFKAKWNLVKDDIWAINPKSFEEVGCIHTCQGMEFDYVGVFVGKDLILKDGKITTNQKAISSDDRTSGIRSCRDAILADKLIKNTYKVLMTRGLKGCYIYCEDKELAKHIKSLIH